MNPSINSLADLPYAIAGRFPERPILRRSVGAALVDTLGRELLELVRDVSLGLGEFGLAPGVRVAVIAESRPEWCITDLAILAAAGVTVAVYPTFTGRQIAGILNDCGATIAVVSDRTQVQKIAALRSSLAHSVTVVVMDPDLPSTEHVVTLAEVAALGRRHRGALSASITRDTLATLIYTSGTTGEPKGVMLTHGNLLSNVEAAVELLGVTEKGLALSFLPSPLPSRPIPSRATWSRCAPRS